MSHLRRSFELSPMIDPNRETRDVMVISVSGPAGAGKSQVAKATAETLGSNIATRVPTDYFFVPRLAGMSLEDYCRQPMTWDWELMVGRFRLPVGSETSTPDVDFTSFARRSDFGGLPFTIRRILFCDAMEPFPASDLVITLDVPDKERQRRIAERDARWQTSVIDRWEHLEITWRAVASIGADVVIDGTQPIEETAAMIAGFVRDVDWSGRGERLF